MKKLVSIVSVALFLVSAPAWSGHYSGILTHKAEDYKNKFWMSCWDKGAKKAHWSKRMTTTTDVLDNHNIDWGVGVHECKGDFVHIAAVLSSGKWKKVAQLSKCPKENGKRGLRVAEVYGTPGFYENQRAGFIVMHACHYPGGKKMTNKIYKRDRGVVDPQLIFTEYGKEPKARD